MNEYMVTINFDQPFTEEFVLLIPRQRAQVNKLLQSGVLTSYSLAADRSMLWATVIANSEEDVMKLLESMPVFQWMKVEMKRLMFHNMPVRSLPAVSMN